jgi:tetratricopeptide (TPR) repeat protein/CHAT domain-containing protein
MRSALVVILIALNAFSIASIAAGDDVRHALTLNKRGAALLGSSNFREAADVFEKMLVSCGDHAFCRGVAMFSLGKTHAETGQFHKALEYYEKSGRIFKELRKTRNLGSNLVAEGKAFAGLSDYPKALECFSEAERLLTGEDASGEMFALRVSRAVVLAYMSEYDKALDSLAEAEKALGQAPTPGDKAALLLNLGLIHEKRQDYDRAVALDREALTLFETAGDAKASCVTMLNLAQVFEAKSEYQSARDLQRKALAKARGCGDRWTEALALNNIGLTEFRMGDYHGALNSLEEARAIRESLGMAHFAAETVNNIGLVYLAQADYPKAIERFRTAREQCERAGVPSGIAWALHNLAYALRDMGRYKESLEASQEAVSIAKRIGDRRIESTASLRLGNLYECQGRFDEAKEHYQRAAKIQEQISDWNFRANTLADLAALSGAQGDSAAAAALYDEAIGLKRKIAAPVGGLLCKAALYHIEAHRYLSPAGDPGDSSSAFNRNASRTRAADYVAQAEKALSPQEGSDLMLLTYVKGRLVAETDPKEAEAQFSRLKDMAESSGVGKYRFLASVGSGLAFEAQGRLDDAERAFRDAVTYAERIRQTLDPYTRMTFLSGEVVFGMKHVVAYEGLARVLMKKGDHAAAFTAAEFTKARAFAESLALRNPEGSHDAPADMIAQDDELTRRVGGLIKALDTAREHGAAEAIKTAEADLDEAVKERDRFVHTLRSAHPLFAAVRHPEPMRAEHTRLRDDEFALVYDVTDSGLLRFLFHGKDPVITSFQRVPRRRVDELVARFRGPLDITEADDPAEKLADFDFDAAKTLADLLVGDALAHIPEGAHVVIVPDDSLGVIPFEALVLNDGGKVTEDAAMPRVIGAEFLGDRYRVSYAQSITALTLARAFHNAAPPQKAALVAADPVYSQRDARAGPAQTYEVAKADREFSISLMNALEKAMGGASFSRLPATGKFAEKFYAMYDGRPVMRTGLLATKKKVMEDLGPDSPSYGSVVFGTHGFFSSNIPSLKEPVLVLTMVPAGTDGLLRMSEVTGLKADTNLAVLMACESGLGRHISGEGTMGMGRAFQHAGAKSVVMSLWSVSEDASVRLFEAFFKNLKQGRDKLEALTLARREIRAAGFDHPFFWAPFILVGETK